MPKTVLTFIDYFYPGYKGGGSTRALYNLIESLSEEYVFYVVTRDRDLGDKLQYSNCERDIWIKHKHCNVIYLSPKYRLLKIVTILQKKYDYIFLNSFFSPIFSILPMILLKFLRPSSTVILAPKGEFFPSAIKNKLFKKSIYILLAKTFNIYPNSIKWLVSSEFEKTQLKKFISTANIETISETPTFDHKAIEHAKKKSKQLKIVFLSRIVKNKNLDGAINILRKVEGDITFHVYGPIEDSNYFNYCLKLTKKLSKNIKFAYHGIVKPNDIIKIFSEYDLFLFPTKGESYGYVIPESLCAGTPILISDRTPWANINESKIGKMLPLDEEQQFSSFIQELVLLDENEYAKIRKNALKYVEKFRSNYIGAKRLQLIFSS